MATWIVFLLFGPAGLNRDQFSQSFTLFGPPSSHPLLWLLAFCGADGFPQVQQPAGARFEHRGVLSHLRLDARLPRGVSKEPRGQTTQRFGCRAVLSVPVSVCRVASVQFLSSGSRWNHSEGLTLKDPWLEPKPQSPQSRVARTLEEESELWLSGVGYLCSRPSK